jgi:cell division protein FtsQ
VGDPDAPELVRRLLRLGVVLSLVAAAVSVAESSAFSVRRVEVYGARALSEEAVRSSSGVRIGQPLVAVDPQAVRRRLLSVPQIAQAWVDVVWPDRVVLRVTERRPVATLRVGKAYVPVDSEGVVLGWWQDAGGLPVLSGRRPPWTRPGETVPSEPLRAAVEELAALPAAVRRGIRSVTVERSGDYAVRTGSGLLVRVAPGELERSLALAEEVVAGLRARGVEPAVVDLRFGERVVVRPAP